MTCIQESHVSLAGEMHVSCVTQRTRETWVAPRVLRDMRDACISACLPGEKYTYCDTMLHLVTLI